MGRNLRRWTGEERGELRRLLAAGVCPVDAAAALGRTPRAVGRAMARMGLRTVRPWTPGEEDRLRELAGGGCHLIKQIARELGRTRLAVENKARKLGVHLQPTHSRWTPGEDAELRRLLAVGATVGEAAAALGRTKFSIWSRTKVLPGAVVLVRPSPIAVGGLAHMWDRVEDRTLLNGMDRGWAPARVARVLGRTTYSVRARAIALGYRNWWQGFASASLIAREFGVSREVVIRIIDKLIWDSETPWVAIGGGQRRFRMSDEQADRVRRVLGGKLRLDRNFRRRRAASLRALGRSPTDSTFRS